jgi:hypothetical protein
MKYRRAWIVASMILVALGFFVVFGPHRLNMGIDFVGGTQINLAFRAEPDLDRIRAVLAQEGFREALIQRYGEAEDRQVIIKTAVAKGTEEGSRDRVVAALNRAFDPGKTGLDLNQAGADTLTQLLVQADPDRRRPPPCSAALASVSSRWWASRTSDLRWAASCGRRASWPWCCRCSPCSSTSGSALSCASPSAP